MKKIICSIVALLCLSCVLAQGKESAGWIKDAVSMAPIEGATVSRVKGTDPELTDEAGRFVLKARASATDCLLVTAIGYESRILAVQSLLKGNATILLQPKAVQLQELTLVAGSRTNHTRVGRIDFRMRSVTNAQEALRLVPGLFIGQHAGGGKAEQIFLRGFDLDHGTDVAITMDGLPVNMVSHAHGQGYADLHFLIPELIEIVSFQKGPYHANKGNMATAGFVDFCTKTSIPENQLKIEVGQFKTLRAVALVKVLNEKAGLKEQSAYVATEYMHTDGYFDHPQNFHRVNMFGKYSGKISSRNRLQLTASTFGSQWLASGQIPERAVKRGLISFFGAIDPNEGGKTSRANVNSSLTTQLRRGTIHTQLYYSRYAFELYSNFSFFHVDSIHGDQIRQKESRDLFGYNTQYSFIGFIADKKLTTDMGLGLRADRVYGSELSRTKDRIELLQSQQLGNIAETNHYMYLNETLTWNEQLTINAGIRWDHLSSGYFDKLNSRHYRIRSSRLSPKLNVYYQLTDKTALYLSTGKGFHSNDARAASGPDGHRLLPAAYGADLGITTKPIKNLLLNLALWQLHLEEEFVYVGDEGVVEPSGRSRRLGLDGSLRYQPWKQWYLDVDANYAHARSAGSRMGENYLPLAPVFTSTGGISYKGPKGFASALRYRYMGDRPANENYSVVAKGYCVADAQLSYAQKSWEAGMAIQNLFNTKWKETQFDIISRLKAEPAPVSEIHFTPGTPFSMRFYFCLRF
jgi:outer membrane receptor protein involved in Fe transport